MELELIRLCSAAAADETIGVNAMLAKVPLDGIDVRPAEMSIINSVDHGVVARRAVPLEGSGVTFPALAIYVPEPADLDPVATTVRDGHFAVNFSFLELESASEKGNRDAAYAMRAIEWFLAHFINPANIALRTRGGVQLLHIRDFTLSTTFQKWDAGIIQSTLLTRCLVRDTIAYGPA